MTIIKWACQQIPVHTGRPGSDSNPNNKCICTNKFTSPGKHMIVVGLGWTKKNYRKKIIPVHLDGRPPHTTYIV